jgi:hypothetical protein
MVMPFPDENHCNHQPEGRRRQTTLAVHLATAAAAAGHTAAVVDPAPKGFREEGVARSSLSTHASIAIPAARSVIHQMWNIF